MTARAFMSAVKWDPTGQHPSGDLPYATHSGEMEIFGLCLRCYRLSTGEAIIHVDDMHALLELIALPPKDGLIYG